MLCYAPTCAILTRENSFSHNSVAVATYNNTLSSWTAEEDFPLFFVVEREDNEVSEIELNLNKKKLFEPIPIVCVVVKDIKEMVGRSIGAANYITCTAVVSVSR